MSPPLAILNLGPGELLVIGLIALLVFGSRLPEVGRSLGKGLMEFKKGLSGIKDDLDEVQTDADLRIEEELERRRNQELLEADSHETDQGEDELHEGEEPPEEALRSQPEESPSEDAADEDDSTVPTPEADAVRPEEEPADDQVGTRRSDD